MTAGDKFTDGSPRILPLSNFFESVAGVSTGGLGFSFYSPYYKHSNISNASPEKATKLTLLQTRPVGEIARC
jgi:hypothetical protein